MSCQRLFVLFKGDVDSPEADPFQAELCGHFEKVVRIPTLSFEYINGEKLCRRLQAASYSGLVFTSPRAVKSVRRGCFEEGRSNPDLLQQLRKKFIFCVGPKTSETLGKELSLEDALGDRISEAGNSEALARFVVANYGHEIRKINLPLLMPCSTIAKDTLSEILNQNEIPVERFPSYQTCSDPNLVNNLEKLFGDYPNHDCYLTFFSPSGLKSVGSALQTLEIAMEKMKLIAIGKTTAKSIQESGLSPLCVAEKPTPESLAEAIVAKVASEKRGG